MQCSTTVVCLCQLFRNLGVGFFVWENGGLRLKRPPPLVAGLDWLVPLEGEVARC